jgi:hypothetical protein
MSQRKSLSPPRPGRNSKTSNNIERYRSLSATGGGNFFDKFGNVCVCPPPAGEVFGGGVGEGLGICIPGICIPGIFISACFGVGTGVAVGAGGEVGDGIGIFISIGILIGDGLGDGVTVGAGLGIFIGISICIGVCVGFGVGEGDIGIFIGIFISAGFAFVVFRVGFRLAFALVCRFDAAGFVFDGDFAVGFFAFGLAFGIGIFIPGISCACAPLDAPRAATKKNAALIKIKTRKRIFISSPPPLVLP